MKTSCTFCDIHRDFIIEGETPLIAETGYCASTQFIESGAFAFDYHGHDATSSSGMSKTHKALGGSEVVMPLRKAGSRTRRNCDERPYTSRECLARLPTRFTINYMRNPDDVVD